MSRKILLSGVAAIALGAATYAPAAKADYIAVGWAGGTGGGDGITYVTQLTNGTAVWTNNVTINNTVVLTSGNAQSPFELAVPGVFNSQSQDNVLIQNYAGTPGALVLYVTASNLNYPASGLTEWLSTFTINGQRGALTDVMSVYLDENNTATYADLTDLLSKATLIAGPVNNAASSITTNTNLSDPYSITEEFVINFSGTGNINDTVAVSAAIPEPTTLALFGAGLLGLGMFRRRRKAS